ncbi:cupin domain-containing protein [Archangium lipolyticum]|uniref:cupin domain-containing protein n=1 Tax=Archangium lipolyticum TaxID=2970465 RepID=UPI00214A650C|nr:cupin domain-containing protein [Archangium lipolyticum]
MSRHVRRHQLLGLGLGALTGLLVACGGEQPRGSTSEGMVSSTSSLEEAAPAGMIVYSTRGKPVSDAGFVWLGPPEVLGGQVLEGNPQIFARIDYSHGGKTVGLFKATKGKIRVTFPFSEHATILEGQVTITDQTGKRHTFKEGDSYFIRQGQVVTWEVKGKEVIKSFFNIVEPQ